MEEARLNKKKKFLQPWSSISYDIIFTVNLMIFKNLKIQRAGARAKIRKKGELQRKKNNCAFATLLEGMQAAEICMLEGMQAAEICMLEKPSEYIAYQSQVECAVILKD